MAGIFRTIALVAAVLMVAVILAQSRGSSLGEAFGGDSAFYHKRRGPELVMFQATIVLAVVFVMAIVLSIVAR